MHAIARLGFALAVVFGPVIVAPAAADEPPAAVGEVSFPSAAVLPTELRQRLARQRGEPPPQPQSGIELAGRLTLPHGAGPFPAVVLLHGCTGPSASLDDWAAKLAAWGYVALQVDSLAPRGIGETCTSAAAPNAGPQVFDAFGALAWLRSQPLTDVRRIAVMGWGHGGTAAIDSVLATGSPTFFEARFAAAVALYPYCPGNIRRRFLAPILVLSGDQDDLMPAARCRRLAARRESGGDRMNLIVYDGAHYGFDDPAQGAPHAVPEVLNIERSPSKGATFGYNAAAHAEAWREVRTFLDRTL